jgi:hypothetical protein
VLLRGGNFRPVRREPSGADARARLDEKISSRNFLVVHMAVGIRPNSD